MFHSFKKYGLGFILSCLFVSLSAHAESPIWHHYREQQEQAEMEDKNKAQAIEEARRKANEALNAPPSFYSQDTSSMKPEIKTSNENVLQETEVETPKRKPAEVNNLSSDQAIERSKQFGGLHAMAAYCGTASSASNRINLSYKNLFIFTKKTYGDDVLKKFMNAYDMEFSRVIRSMKQNKNTAKSCTEFGRQMNIFLDDSD